MKKSRSLILLVTYFLLYMCSFTACSTQPKKPQDNAARERSQKPDQLKGAILEYQTRLQQINRARIIAGQFAEPGQFPWQAALVKAGYSPRDGQFCGGAIIAARWILTAAHCFPPGSQAADQDVFVGSVDLQSGGSPQEIDPLKSRLQKIDRIYVHERYNSLTFDNDVALLLLSADISSGEPIDLLQAAEAPSALTVRREGRVSGWGRISENGPTSSRLKYVDVPIADQTKCASNYRKLNANYVITSNMICAGFDTDNRGDSCQGDSGGPFVTPVEGKFKLAGVVSWGVGCSKAGLYGLYTRLPNYLPWINAHTKATDNAVSATSPAAEAQNTEVKSARPEWMANVDWSITNSDAGGSTDCPLEYPYPGCVLSGGRACLMIQAIASAKANDCANAFRVTRLTQCHNPKARQSISEAGQDAVCRYLRSK